MLNYGKFFRLNNEKSDLGKGITVFDYIWLRDNENKNGSPEFPIYVTISKDSIDFHSHYHEDYTNTDGKHIHKHLHNTILSLPLSTNLEVRDGLTGALVDGFKTNYPRHIKNKDESASNYLFKLILKNAFVHKESINKEGTDIHYSNLSCFYDEKENMDILHIYSLKNDVAKFITDIFNESELDSRRNQIEDFAWSFTSNIADSESLSDVVVSYHRKLFIHNDFELNMRFNCKMQEKENYPKITFNCFIRKLILDFIFDLEHTNTFQTSPLYEHISVKLKENYFFSALAAKANFYYWREKIQKDNNKNNSVYIEYYLKAKMQWEKAIRSPKAEENFNGYEDEWFNDPEIEMNNVRLSWFSQEKEIRKTDKQIFEKAEIKTSEEKQNKKGFGFTDNFIDRFINNKKLSDNWQQSHYYLWHKGWQWAFISRLLISTVAVWLTFILGSNLWGNVASSNESFQKINPKCWIVLFFCLVLCIASFWWLIHLRRKNKINHKNKETKRQIRIGAAYMTFLSFIYSAIIGAILRIFVFHTEKYECCGEVHYNHCRQWQYWCGEQAHFYWVAVCLAVFIGVVIQSFMFIDNKSPAEEL